MNSFVAIVGWFLPDGVEPLEEIRDDSPLPARDLLPLVYEELRRLAEVRLAAEPPGQTLQATALVHEAYLRVVGKDHDQPWDGRNHLFAAAAEAMRRILVDRARRRKAIRHGGGRNRVSLEEAAPEMKDADDDLLALDEALAEFAAQDPGKARLVQLRYFGGLSLPQAADLLGISIATATRHWAYARAWLRVEMSDDPEL